MNALFARFGLPIVFLAALIEALVMAGIVFPGVVVIFLGGVYAAEQDTPVALVLALATVGTVLGDWISYSLGRWGGARLSSSRLGPSLRLGEALIAGRARLLIPFYHLHSMTRAVGPFGAGALRLRLRVWAPLDLAGAVIANSVWVGAGVIFGRTLLTEDGTLQQHPALRITLYLAAVVWVLFLQREVLKAVGRERAKRIDSAEGADGVEGAEGPEAAEPLEEARRRR